ncbi:PhnD/SsuA/transferrin family substrate-binding protein [Alteromonas ponticola]|uniref:PhnD/SsuA/transferrin family substrate-binding protein n=1 Tax=Alteromonas ponticola TaxID=2720613 RepID=A0ABX1R4N2_9ALTE|nr:PhnD/SsuA/transferrin family substrate-binding protein [Alteromonas ponticola]NMH61399.1 PhnD/SsuA/transferrin family substrate-binding protein [Alteromonas ponticola]
MTIMFGYFGFTKVYYEVVDVSPQITHTLRCDTRLSENQSNFSVYITDRAVAGPALKLLCNNNVVKRQFGQVEVRIGHSDLDTFRYINHGVSDLALIKSNIVEAFVADEIYGYQAIAMYPDYQAYFIALREKPLITKEYLLGKRIGLLDYPSSRSGHIIPKTVLNSLGLNENTVTLTYYNSHNELRQALLADKVDIISTYWDQTDNQTLSPNYITPINDTVTGMRWYLKMRTQNTDLKCAIQNIIKTLASAQPKGYYKRVEIVGDCNE